MRLLILVALALTAAAARPDAGYDPRYDSFNAEELVENTRLLRGYSLCFLGEGNCTPDGKNFKKWMPDAVQTNCGKCSEKQKMIVAKVIKALEAKLPSEWERLVKIYDPEKKHTAELNDFVKKYAP